MNPEIQPTSPLDLAGVGVFNLAAGKLEGLALLVARPGRRGSQPARPRPFRGGAAPQLGGAAGIPYCPGVKPPRCTRRA